MTDKEIVKSNKLIAKFMGYESYKYRDYTMFVLEDNNHRTMIDLHYHNSFDWLMPVVEKIESIEHDDIYYEFSIHGGCCVYVMSNNGKEIVCIDNEDTKLLCLYKSIVEFIKLYNKWKAI